MLGLVLMLGVAQVDEPPDALTGEWWAPPAAPVPAAPPPDLTPEVRLAAHLAGDQLTGRANWRYTNPTARALDVLHFTLPANALAEANEELSVYGRAVAGGHFNSWEPGGTVVSAVADEGGTAMRWRYVDAVPVTRTYSLSRAYLEVALAAPLEPGESVTVVITFTTSVPRRRGDQGRFNGTTTWRFGWFPAPRWHDGADWSEQPLLVAFRHETTVTAAPGASVILGGDEVEALPGQGRSRSRAPVRSVPLVVSTSLRRSAQARVGGVAVNVFTYGDLDPLDTSAGEASEKLEQIEKMLRWFGPRYGAYRLRSLQIIESPTPTLSMAADGMILLSELFFVHDRTLLAWRVYAPVGERVLAHELAHQWWGLGVGVDFDRDNWLSEALSELMAFDYAQAHLRDEDMLDPSVALIWAFAHAGVALPENELRHRTLIAYERSLRDGVDVPVTSYQRERQHVEQTAHAVYRKGYLAARALGGWIGMERLRAALRELAASAGQEPIDNDDLAAAVSSVSGVDVRPFLRTFVEGTTSGDLLIDGVEASPGRAVVRVRRVGDLVVPVRVQVECARDRHVLAWDTRDPEVALEVPCRARQVVVDPDFVYPDQARHNNGWGVEADITFGAPHADATGVQVAFNPLPLHPEYLIGVSFGVRDRDRTAFWFGGGLRELASADRLFGREYVGYARVAQATTRAGTLGLLGRFRQREHALAYGFVGTTLAASHDWALFEDTDLGNTGVLEVPRTILGLSLSWNMLEHGCAPYCFGGRASNVELGGRIRRDEIMKIGAALELEPFVGLDTQRDAHYLGGAATLEYVTVIPYVGRLGLQLTGAGVSFQGPLDSRPDLHALPWTTSQLAFNPYDAAVDAGATLRLPLLRDAGVKSSLWLQAFVLNDVSLVLHYGAAFGQRWDTDGPYGFVREGVSADLSSARLDTFSELLDAEALGEASAALSFGLSVAELVRFEVQVGYAGQVAPSAFVDLDAAWFLRLDTTL